MDRDNIKIGEKVMVYATTRNGVIVKEESGVGIIRCIRRKCFFVELLKNKRAIRFDMLGKGVNSLYNTICVWKKDSVI